MDDRHIPFLRAIVANPDDDMPRLVYADWLDEPGPHFEPARAEFIRTQIDIEGLRARKTGMITCEGKGPPFSCSHLRQYRKRCRCEPCSLRRREWDLLSHHGCDWEGEIRQPVAELMVTEALESGRPIRTDPLALPAVGQIVFRRGFITDLSCTWATWSRHADQFLAVAPLRRVNRAKPRDCFVCGGSGRLYADIVRCRHCDGTGKIPAAEPEWVGDGVVRLTTWPCVEPTGRYAGDCRLAGGPHTVTGNAAMITDLLAAEYPGVRFELPANSSWDTPPTPWADIRRLRDRLLTDPARRITEYVQAHAAEFGVTGEVRHTIDVRAERPDLHTFCPACTPRAVSLQWADPPRKLTQVSLRRYVLDGEWTVYVGQCSECRAGVMTRPQVTDRRPTPVG